MKILATSISAAALLLAASAAHAQSITFTESSQGQFNGAGGFMTSPTLMELRFTGATYTDTTTNGFIAYGGFGSSNFGVFTLANGTDTFTGNTFQLQLTFSQPNGTTPATVVIPATLTGAISSGGGGGVFVDFDNTPRNFTFNGGSFSLTVLDAAINAAAPGQTSQTALGGFITAVPEPSTYAMILGASLLSIVGFRRKHARA